MRNFDPFLVKKKRKRKLKFLIELPPLCIFVNVIRDLTGIKKRGDSRRFNY